MFAEQASGFHQLGREAPVRIDDVCLMWHVAGKFGGLQKASDVNDRWAEITAWLVCWGFC